MTFRVQNEGSCLILSGATISPRQLLWKRGNDHFISCPQRQLMAALPAGAAAFFVTSLSEAAAVVLPQSQQTTFTTLGLLFGPLIFANLGDWLWSRAVKLFLPGGGKAREVMEIDVLNRDRLREIARLVYNPPDLYEHYYRSYLTRVRPPIVKNGFCFDGEGRIVDEGEVLITALLDFEGHLLAYSSPTILNAAQQKSLDVLSRSEEARASARVIRAGHPYFYEYLSGGWRMKFLEGLATHLDKVVQQGIKHNQRQARTAIFIYKRTLDDQGQSMYSVSGEMKRTGPKPMITIRITCHLTVKGPTLMYPVVHRGLPDEVVRLLQFFKSRESLTKKDFS